MGRRAFSMVEVLVTLVILGLIAAIAISSSMAPREQADNLAGVLTLSSAQTDVEKLAYENYGVYPASINPHTQSLTYTTGNAAEKVVSYKRVSDQLVILATLDGAGRCVWVFDSLDSQPKWGTAQDPGPCSAETLDQPDVADATLSTDPQYPSTVTLN